MKNILLALQTEFTEGGAKVTFTGERIVEVSAGGSVMVALDDVVQPLASTTCTV